MSASFNSNLSRVIELLADRAAGPLSPAEEQELSALMAGLPTDQRTVARLEEQRLQRGAAEALAYMMQRDRAGGVPATLRDRLIASGMAELGSTATRSGPPGEAVYGAARRPSFPLAGLSGWIAAAAVLVAVFIYHYRPTPTPILTAPTFFAQRAQLLNAPGTVVAAWTPGPDPAGAGVTGDVIWNPALQAGFLRFSGLAENDPARFQYQLWIFDKTRQPDKPVLEQFPVDGGVFDLSAAQRDPATGDYIVPINAKLRVGEAAAFALTSEKPGGVVVTTRENLLLLAPIGG